MRNPSAAPPGSGPVVWAGLIVPILLVGGSVACASGTTSSHGTTTPLDDSGFVAAADSRVSLSGWLHVIRNGEPRFVLVDDRGRAIRLVIDEALLRTFGGPRGLAQKRVTIEGERADDTPEVIRVLSIELDARSK